MQTENGEKIITEYCKKDKKFDRNTSFNKWFYIRERN